jgi:Mg2+-importing ATPase
MLFRQFLSPMVIILLVAATLSLALGQAEEALIVCAIVLASTGLGYYQEYRAGNALADLEQRIAINAIVLRDGKSRSVAVTAVVPGDLLELKAGSLVAADAILVESKELYADEAALTGESYPAEKRAAMAEGPIMASNRVHLGTSIRTGQARALVTATGSGTEYGALVGLVAHAEPETSFARGIRQFGLLMTQVMLVLVTVVLVANVLLGRPVLESLLFAAALAVGITPELLPAIVTVTLSQGARNLAKKGVLTRRLVAIENLGSMDLLCVDKTGTLTVGELTLVGAVDPAGTKSPVTLKWAIVNSHFQTAMPNPLDTAILERRDEIAGPIAYTKLGEAAYDFERKRLSVLVDGEEGRTLVCKGSANSVLEKCNSILTAFGPSPLTSEARAEQEKLQRGWGATGLRVLAVATKSKDVEPCTPKAETGMTLIGYLLFADPTKPNIEENVAALRKSGIEIRIISGDSRYVAQHVAESVGLATRLVTGSELDALNDRALARRIRGKTVFAEIAPDQKERIVAALRKAGHTVGFLGDGINDAPALRAADVGISVDNAVDAARAAADIILLERDLMVLLDGIIAGRHAFANTIKYISITISANLGNMLSMAVASLALPFLPLTASQVLLNNLLSDLPMLAVSTDRVDTQMLARPWQWNFPALLRSMIAFGLLSSFFDGLTFVVLLSVFRAGEPTFQSAWFVESLLTELAVVAVMRTALPFFKQTPSRLLTTASAAIAAAAIVVPYTPIAGLIGFVPLPFGLLCTILVIVASYVLATELLKARISPFEIKAPA